MSTDLTLKLSNKSTKKAVKKLPPSVDLASNTTVEQLKQLIASKCGVSDPSRIGLFDPRTRKTLKDRKAVLRNLDVVEECGELLVQDLGPQVAWRTVFIIEYAGPLLFHPLVGNLRQYIYPAIFPYMEKYVHEPSWELSAAQHLTFAFVMGHFLKRELETMFVHKFSATTMPAANVFWNSSFYWFLAGLFGALEVYAPFARASRHGNSDTVNFFAIWFFVIGESLNAYIHLYLATLRSAGGTERQIPKGWAFELCTCPNYFFEIIAWAGIILMSRSIFLSIFIGIGMYWMYVWGKQKEAAYRKQFGSQYRKKRYIMFPGLI